MNIINFLENANIEVIKRGKNVSAGWISITCPFCGDTSNHFGIQLSDLRCNCWKCGSHTIIDLITTIESCSFKRAKSIVKEIRDSEPPVYLQRREQIRGVYQYRKVHLPPVVSPLPKRYREYLQDRGFNPTHLERKYGLLACLNRTKYKFRIVIPIFFMNKLVSFTTRTIFNEIDPPYLHPTYKEVLYTPKQTVYNYDSFPTGTDLIVMEGPSDVWRWGNGAVSTNGINYSIDQIITLRSKPIRRLFLFFDNELTAQARARELILLIKPAAKHVEQIKPDHKNDPGEMTHSEIMYIKQHLKFNK